MSKREQTQTWIAFSLFVIILLMAFTIHAQLGADAPAALLSNFFTP